MTLNDLKSAWATPPTGLPNSPAAADRADSLAAGGPAPKAGQSESTDD